MSKLTNKVTIIGAGNVGATTAYTLLLSGLVSDLVLIDLNKDKAIGETLDLAHGIPLCPPAQIIAGDYPDCKDSDIVIITAGANRKPGETRLDLTKKNMAVISQIVPNVIKYAPNTILLMVTNPVDVLTYAAQKISNLPPGRVIGSGTLLDTSRLRYILSEHTNIDPRNIHSYIIGEHGDTRVACWSLTTIAGVNINTYCERCGKCASNLLDFSLQKFNDDVKNTALEIIKRKGATYYAIALAISRIVQAILRDERSILTVSGKLQGQYGIDDVCLSLPAVVGINGIERILEIPLSKEERENLRLSADTIKKAIAESI